MPLGDSALTGLAIEHERSCMLVSLGLGGEGDAGGKCESGDCPNTTTGMFAAVCCNSQAGPSHPTPPVLQASGVSACAIPENPDTDINTIIAATVVAEIGDSAVRKISPIGGLVGLGAQRVNPGAIRGALQHLVHPLLVAIGLMVGLQSWTLFAFAFIASHIATLVLRKFLLLAV